MPKILKSTHQSSTVDSKSKIKISAPSLLQKQFFIIFLSKLNSETNDKIKNEYSFFMNQRMHYKISVSIITNFCTETVRLILIRIQ